MIVDAVLAGRIPAGMRLGEQALADVFSVSRTTVREALIRLGLGTSRVGSYASPRAKGRTVR